MKLLLITVTLLATTWAQTLSGEYLPPVEEYSGASSNAVESNFLENEPAHTLADDGYRYKTVKRFRLRHRRDVSELSSSYLPPHAASAPAPVYSAPAETAPAPVYSAPAPEAETETYEVEASEPAPAHSLGEDGYHYRSVKRYRLRRRRDVNELSNNYLPPHAASDPAPVYSAPAETAPAPAYSAPAPEAETETYEVEASEPAPAHSLGEDGYHYRSVKRYRLRRRRDVNELSNNYLPPHAASDPAPVYSAPAETAPAPVSSAPAPEVETYEVEASEPAPAHSLGEDGYHYRSVKRYRLRRRRDVNELSNNYLPPHAASDPAPVYSAPAETAPAPVSSAPAPEVETYEVEASEPAPAHSLGEDGYHYRSVKRYRLRRRRDVNELSNNYLPPHAASDPAPVYSAPAETAPAPAYSAPAPEAETETYEVEASEPALAHSLGEDGYHYRSVKRYRLRRRRDVNELSNNYLPPHAASDPAPVYSAPAETAPAPAYSAPAPEAETETYEVEASEPAPAHSLGEDGYHYRSVKRYRLRRRRDVNELSNNYLPPHAASDPAPVYSAPAETAPAPAYSAPAPEAETYEVEASEPAPAHSLGEDGYHYRSVKRYRLRRRRDVNELSNNYLPPHAASDPAPVYSAPAETAPAPVSSAPAPEVETYEVEASEPAPAHSLGEDGYHYRSVKRYRLRRRRDVNELSNSYLPPHAASAPAPVYSAPAETAPTPEYSAPASETYDTEASEPAPAHSFGDDGYRYKAVKRYRLRLRY